MTLKVKPVLCSRSGYLVMLHDLVSTCKMNFFNGSMAKQSMIRCIFNNIICRPDSSPKEPVWTAQRQSAEWPGTQWPSKCRSVHPPVWHRRQLQTAAGGSWFIHYIWLLTSVLSHDIQKYFLMCFSVTVPLDTVGVWTIAARSEQGPGLHLAQRPLTVTNKVTYTRIRI